MQFESLTPSIRRATLALAAAGLAQAAAAQTVSLKANIDAAQEVPSNASTGTGTATAVMDLAANTLTLDMSFTGLTTAQTAAHIHGFAAPGTNGGVQFNLGTGNPKSAVWNYPESAEQDILAGLTYINIHSSMFGGGEIRGQLVRDPAAVVMAGTIDASQEVPANGSGGTGTLHASIDTVANTLALDLTFDGLSAPETVAHIHGPAAPGSNAGVKFALPSGNTKSAVWNYAESDEADILAGLMYVNIHSSAFAGGEIRGQILASTTNPTTYCTASTTSIAGCAATISTSGQPSASAGSGFTISAGPAPGGNLGIMYYGKSGPAAISFGANGGFICANSSTLLRLFVGSSGGTNGVCNGTYAVDFNAHIASGVDPLLVAGTEVNLGTWFRDPPNGPDGFALSNAVMFQVRP